MAKEPKSTKVPRIQVLRSPYDGKLYSEIVGKLADKETGVVVDRQHGRGMDDDTVKYRASQIALILNLPLHVDTSWVCLALKKQPCRCPRCNP